MNGGVGHNRERQDTVRLKLHEVELNAKDPEASKRFYHHMLGLRISIDEDHLKVFDTGWPGVDLDASGHHPGQMSVSFLVEDLDRFVTELRAKGMEVADPQPAHLGMRNVVLTDPDGNRIAVQSPTETSPEWLKRML
jgi:catechol 2,3-dioxygenase-like lactoylglutathione lyase family enzyme